MAKNKEATRKTDATDSLPEEGIDQEELVEFEEAEEEAEGIVATNPNDAIRSQIADRHNAQRAEELGQSLEMESAEEDSSSEEDEAEEKEEEKLSVDEDDTDDPDPFVTVKISGQEQKIKQSDLIAGYQIETIARQRLHDAEKVKREYEARLATLESQKQSQNNQENTQITTSVEESDLDLTEIIKSIREGEDEDAEKAMAQFYQHLVSKQKPSTPVVDIETLVDKKLREKEQAAEEARIRALEVEAEVARESFTKQYEKDLQNPDFWNLAVMEDTKLQENPEWADKPLRERYMEAGKRARGWFGKSESDSEKTKTKSLTKPVKGRTARAKLGEDETIPSASDIIRGMAKQRGQTLY